MASNALSTENERKVIEWALSKIFGNLKVNLGFSFSVWRQVNQIEKLRGEMVKVKKSNAVGLLGDVVSRGRTNRVREMINKFIWNYRAERKKVDVCLRIV